LANYLRTRAWKTDSFSHWLVLSLIFGVMGQAAFMSFAGEAFDSRFILGHVLKLVSFGLALGGLAVNIFETFRSASENENRLSAMRDALVDGIITIDPHGRIKSANPPPERIFRCSITELLEQDVKLLMPEPHRSAHDDPLHRYAEGGPARIIGMGRHFSGNERTARSYPWSAR
jgi:PAS domain S-box-containing protein